MLLREFDYIRPSMATVTIIREYGGWDPLLYEARTQMDQAGFRVNVDGYGRSGRACGAKRIQSHFASHDTFQVMV